MAKYNSVCFIEHGFTVFHPSEDPLEDDGFWVAKDAREKIEGLFESYLSMSDEELVAALIFTDTLEEVDEEKMEIIPCTNGVGEWEIQPTHDTFDTREEAEEALAEYKENLAKIKEGSC